MTGGSDDAARRFYAAVTDGGKRTYTHTFINLVGEDSMVKKVEFSVIEHHETVRSKLGKMVDGGEITKKDAERSYNDWLKARGDARNEAKHGKGGRK